MVCFCVSPIWTCPTSPFTHPLWKRSLWAYCVPDTVLGPWDTTWAKQRPLRLGRLQSGKNFFKMSKLCILQAGKGCGKNKKYKVKVVRSAQAGWSGEGNAGTKTWRRWGNEPRSYLGKSFLSRRNSQVLRRACVCSVWGNTTSYWVTFRKIILTKRV